MSKTKKVFTALAGLAVGVFSVLAANNGGLISQSSKDLLTAVFQEADEPGGAEMLEKINSQEARVFWDYSGGGFQIIEENSFEAPVMENLIENRFENLNKNDLVGKAANELAKRGAIELNENRNFNTNEKVNKAEAVKTILLVKNKNWKNVSNNGIFADVEDDVWYTKYIMNAAFLGMVSGNQTKHVFPLSSVNTAEFAKMLAIGFDMPLNLSFTFEDVSQKDWFAPYVGAMQKYQLFPEKRNLFEPHKKISREEMVVAIYQFLLNRKL